VIQLKYRSTKTAPNGSFDVWRYHISKQQHTMAAHWPKNCSEVSTVFYAKRTQRIRSNNHDSEIRGTSLLWRTLPQGGNFEGERVETPFPFYGRHCEPFSGQKALDCGILHIQSQKFSTMVPRTPAAKGRRFRCLDPDTSFRLARQRSHCSCVTKQPHACLSS